MSTPIKLTDTNLDGFEPDGEIKIPASNAPEGLFIVVTLRLDYYSFQP